MSDDSDSAGEGTSFRAKKKIKYSQYYKADWENEPQFNGWLTKSNQGRNFAKCKACNKDINISSGKDSLMKHKSRKIHEQNVKSLQKQSSITTFLSDVPKKKQLEENIKEGLFFKLLLNNYFF